MTDRIQQIRDRMNGSDWSEFHDNAYDDMAWLLERVEALELDKAGFAAVSEDQHIEIVRLTKKLEELEGAFKAYMRLVIFHESQTFMNYHKSTEFTDSELSLAKEIESEVWEEYR